MLPFADLGLIIVDEEHETAYKQEDGVNYHAPRHGGGSGADREAAVVHASATPSIESQVNARAVDTNISASPTDMAAAAYPGSRPSTCGRKAPGAAPVDRATARSGDPRDKRSGEASRPCSLPQPARLCAADALCRLRASLAMPQLLGPGLSIIASGARLSAIIAAMSSGGPRACIACDSEESIVACGPGVERLAEEVAQKFPGCAADCALLGFSRRADRMREELEAVARGDFPIVIGTQLIAKGHNFPHVTLAAVIDADIGLASGDPRAAERTFQLLQQITGRPDGGKARSRFAPDLSAGSPGDESAAVRQRRALLTRRKSPCGRKRNCRPSAGLPR